MNECCIRWDVNALSSTCVSSAGMSPYDALARTLVTDLDAMVLSVE